MEDVTTCQSHLPAVENGRLGIGFSDAQAAITC
jgi:hypothetical protein